MRPSRPLLALAGALVLAMMLVAVVTTGGDGGPGGGTAVDRAVEADRTAARVGGVEISAGQVDERVSILATGAGGDTDLEGVGAGDRAQLRALALTQLVVVTILEQGAAQLGVTVDDGDIAEARSLLAAELGGEDELRGAIAEAGGSDAVLAEELRFLLLLDGVGAALTGGEPLAEGELFAPEGAEVRQQAAERWLAEQLALAEPEVHPDFGTWDPEAGAVRPVEA